MKDRGTKASPGGPAAESEIAPGRIAVVGLGLIGFSLVLSLSGTGVSLLGVEPDSHAREAIAGYRATALGAREVDPRPGTRLAEADLVVLAVPMEVLAEVAASVGPFLRPGATLTDTASLKAEPLHQLEAAAPSEVGVVGGHPMAGRERGGAQNATAGLFAGHPWAIAEGSRTRPVDLARVTWMARRVGARPVRVNAAAHDRAIAVTSHLPYLAASALSRATARLAQSDPAVAALIGTGWRDATRLADQPPWMDLACTRNSQALEKALACLAEELDRTREALSGTQAEVAASLEEVGRQGRRARHELLDAPPGPGRPPLSG